MNNQQMTNYLKAIAQLEASIYTQTQVVAALPAKIDAGKPKYRTLEKPKQPEYKRYPGSEPKKPSVTENDTGTAVLFWSLIIMGIVTIMVGFVDFGFSGENMLKFRKATCLLSIPVFIYPIIKIIQYLKSEERKNYPKKLQEYKEKEKKFEETINQSYKNELEWYEINMKSYDERAAKHKADFANELASYKSKTGKLLTESKSNLEKSKDTLQKLYNKDIIFGKYRNLVAMTTIYEYFASGRCAELTGPNGAYNLFESELRQNLIIMELSVINQNLQQIQNNQYTLYAELKKGNEIQQRILGAVNSIALDSAITSYCAQVTALNTTAQTAMML